MTQTTPQEAIVRMLANNPQPMSFSTLADAILAVLAHDGWTVVRREMADAQ